MPVLGPDPKPTRVNGYRCGSSFSETISFGLQRLFCLNKLINSVYAWIRTDIHKSVQKEIVSDAFEKKVMLEPPKL